jgi:hypothetical protein
VVPLNQTSGRCVPTAKKDTHRPGLAPALGLRAGNDGSFIVAQAKLHKEIQTMSLTTWLSERLRLSSRTRRPAEKRRSALRAFRPSVECLEERYVPSTLTVDHDWNNHAPASAPPPSGTLEWAAATAHNGDTILITGDAVNRGINLTHGEVILTQQNLTIETAANKSAATISGMNLSRLFELVGGAQVTLSNLVLTAGNSVSANPAGSDDGFGGAMLVNAGAALTVNGCALTSNLAYADGAGVENYGTLTVTSSTLANNIAYQGSGGIENYGMLTVSGSTLANNYGAFTGGGITNFATLTISGSTLSNNGPGFGLGIIMNVSGTATVSGCTLSDDDPYGSIFNSATLSVTNCSFSGYEGLFNEGGTAVVSNSTFVGEQQAIENSFGTLVLSACTVSGNYYDGIANYENGTLVVSGCTVSGNGTGIVNYSNGTVTVANSTFCANTIGNIFGPYLDGGGNSFC